jgi:hypothetical protein
MHLPNSMLQPLEGTDALQDGWVNPSKTLRKSAPFEPQIQPKEPKTESESWDTLQDGWDNRK